MAGKYGSSSVSVAYDDGPGGSARTVTANITKIGDVAIESMQEDSTAYGDTIRKQLPTGVKELPDIEFEGWWDTTATTGTHAVFGTPDTDPNGSTRTLTIGFGDSKTWATEGFLKSYRVIATVGQLQKFKAVVTQNSGGWS